MSHTLDTNRLNEVFAYLGDFTERMSDWEKGFYENMCDLWSNGQHLTDRQLEKLEQIYIKY